jgi:hypothetical protein
MMRHSAWRGGLPKGDDAAKSGHHAVIPITFARQQGCRRLGSVLPARRRNIFPCRGAAAVQFFPVTSNFRSGDAEERA